MWQPLFCGNQRKRVGKKKGGGGVKKNNRAERTGIYKIQKKKVENNVARSHYNMKVSIKDGGDPHAGHMLLGEFDLMVIGYVFALLLCLFLFICSGCRLFRSDPVVNAKKTS